MNELFWLFMLAAIISLWTGDSISEVIGWTNKKKA